MKKSTLQRLGTIFLPVVLPSALLGQSGLGVTLSPLTSFGGGDGWLAPGEGGYAYLGTGNLERGLAFGNGHLYLVSRAGGVNVRVLHGASGADLGGLNTTGITGGTFAANTVGVGGDGAIYVGNLTTAATSPFKIYKWTDESAAPSVAYNVNPGLPRIGDSFAVRGSGDATVIVASGTGSAGFASFSGGNASVVAVPGTATGDFRLGLAFADDNLVVGTQGGTWRLVQYAGNAGTLLLSAPTTSASERPLSYTEIAGMGLLATVDTASSLVRVYDVTNPAAIALLATGNNTTGTLASNGNGVGSVAWGTLEDGSPALYAMSANQGIQAFAVTIVPEPGTYALLALGIGGLFFFRRRP
ncbi:MAG: DUF4623 domain-containing protein [Verrucomicrobiota bacterium]